MYVHLVYGALLTQLTLPSCDLLICVINNVINTEVYMLCINGNTPECPA